LRSHAFVGVDFDEIIESGFYTNYLNAPIIVDLGAGKGQDKVAEVLEGWVKG
jgi:hypothetical protein